MLETEHVSVTFDCDTPDASPSALKWVWTDFPGWWEPPGVVRDTLEGLGTPEVSQPTAARWTPRSLTLMASVRLFGAAGLIDALSTLTAMCDMLRTPGTVTSTEDVPKSLAVRLADRPRYTIVGESASLDVEIPMIAHQPLRMVVAGGALVI